MGWYNHPDTLCIATANGAADKTGHPRDSVEWLQAYRNAYAHTAGFAANDYIQELDAKIRARGGTPAPLKVSEE